MIVEITIHSSPGKVLEQTIKQATFNHWNITVIKRARKKTCQVSSISVFDGLIGSAGNRRAVDVFQLE